MDFIIELLVQFVVQIVVEIVAEALLETAFHGAAKALRSRIGRIGIGALAGLGFGLVWGHHLSGGATWPKLLWVSITLSAAATLLVVQRTRGYLRRDAPRVTGWGRLIDPPWRWSVERLVGFAVINVALAAGIAASFSPASR